MTHKSEGVGARSSEVMLGPNPIVGFRARDVAREILRVARLTATQPRLSARAAAGFGGELRRVLRGESALAPHPRDKRFADPSWKDDARYRKWLQAYLAF